MSGTFNLSFQDKYILAFEREDLPFNSHLVLEVDGELDRERIITSWEKFVEREPFVLIYPDYNDGRFRLRETHEGAQIFYSLDEDQLDDYWDKRFKFPDDLNVRLAIVGKKKIILSFHHSIYDGHAQFNLLKDFLDVYLVKNFEPHTMQDVFRFRKYFLRTTNLSWIIKNILPLMKVQKKKGKTSIARLNDFEPDSRKVDMELIELERKIMDAGARKRALSSSAYISLVGAKAMDKLLCERGESENPIVLYITKSMRFELKVPRAYQNLLGFIWMKIDRSEIKNSDFDAKFRDTYKFRSGEDEVKKTLFLGALLTRLNSFKKLQEILKKKEQRVHDCTLLVSSGRTPPELEFPEEWKVTRLYAKGSMHRSPGIGLLVTSFKQKDFICIEYLRDSFKKETINRFKELLQKELQE